MTLNEKAGRKIIFDIEKLQIFFNGHEVHAMNTPFLKIVLPDGLKFNILSHHKSFISTFQLFQCGEQKKVDKN